MRVIRQYVEVAKQINGKMELETIIIVIMDVKLRITVLVCNLKRKGRNRAHNQGCEYYIYITNCSA